MQQQVNIPKERQVGVYREKCNIFKLQDCRLAPCKSWGLICSSTKRWCADSSGTCESWWQTELWNERKISFRGIHHAQDTQWLVRWLFIRLFTTCLRCTEELPGKGTALTLKILFRQTTGEIWKDGYVW